MKTKNLIIYIAGLLLATPVPGYATQPKRKTARAAGVQTESSQNAEIRELLRRTQQSIEQAQAEARRAREQNEELQRRLEENTRELTRLRQEIAEFGSRIADFGSRNQDSSNPQSAIPNPQSNNPQSNNPPSNVQQPTIDDRIDRLQEQVDINTSQIKEHAQTKVESDSKFRVKLFGMILANTYLNTSDSSLDDAPLFAPPPGSDVGKNNVGATLRQSRIGLAMEGPRLSRRLGEPRLSAEIELDFWGGTNGRIDGDTLGLLRILTASARLDWERTSLVVGQRPPLISPLNPTSIAAVWLPPLSSSGNISQWRPQITLGHRVKMNDFSQMIIQGGVITPFGESLQGSTIEGGPGYQSRIAYRRSFDSDQSLEFGFGGYFHRRPFSHDRRVDSFAITGDWIFPLGGRILLSGEAYWGKAVGLGERSGGRNDRVYAVTGPIESPSTSVSGVYSGGGWAQLAIRARSDLDFNLAYGQEDPRNRDVFAGLLNPFTRLKNQTASANFIWQLRHNFLLSLEYRRFWTNYVEKQQTGNHYNLAIGYVF